MNDDDNGVRDDNSDEWSLLPTLPPASSSSPWSLSSATTTTLSYAADAGVQAGGNGDGARLSGRREDAPPPLELLRDKRDALLHERERVLRIPHAGNSPYLRHRLRCCDRALELIDKRLQASAGATDATTAAVAAPTVHQGRGSVADANTRRDEDDELAALLGSLSM